MMVLNGDIKKIHEELDQICAHALFVNSNIYTRLLRYLVDKAIEQEDIKEYTIGTELFDKNYVSDKNDGTVRIYMYKLRKKLDKYYAETHARHSIFFEIKKGQYNLHFVTKKEYKQKNKAESIHISIQHLKLAGIVVAITLLSILGIKAIHNKAPEPWHRFFTNGSKNMLVVADKYVLMGTDAYGEKHATLYGNINSDVDFFAFKKENPDRQLEPTDYTLLSKMAPYSTQHLTEWFMRKGHHLDLQLESELSLEDIKENNIIFVGQRKAMNISISLFLKDSKVFSKYKDGYLYKNGGEEKIYNTIHNPKGKVEYAMVSFCSLSPGKEAIYFVSNHDIGVMATLRNFTDKDWLKEFYRQLPAKNRHFNALFRVRGIYRTDVSCELVELEIL